MAKQYSKDNTIFDDVFRTIVEKMTFLVIPLINEVFGTDYASDEKIQTLHNEHQQKDGKVITDSCLLIRNHIYHIECQSTSDPYMAIRMIEYDFQIALEHVEKADGMYEMQFPRSCTLYLRHTEKTPDELKVKVYFGNATEEDRKYIIYTTPVIKMQNYTKDDIFRKKLLLFLPFYIMRYEKEFRQIEENSERMEQFLEEYRELLKQLEDCATKDRGGYYTDLIHLIRRISEYMLRKQDELKEKVGDVMGGKVLELPSDVFRNEGIAIGMSKGRAEGLAEGRAEGRAEGLAEGRAEIAANAKKIFTLYTKGFTVDQIVMELEISKEDVLSILPDDEISD